MELINKINNLEKRDKIILVVSGVSLAIGLLIFAFRKKIIEMIQLSRIFTSAKKTNLLIYQPLLDQYMSLYGINNHARISAFLAQIGHESGQLNYTEEIASGAAYEFRKDLGNLLKGDGEKYKGRGLIQITGRKNYKDLSTAFGVDFINNPKLLREPEWAVKSACWWWNNKGLNTIADANTNESFVQITKIINGGTNGLTDRMNLWERAKKIIV